MEEDEESYKRVSDVILLRLEFVGMGLIMVVGRFKLTFCTET